jgi:hypothetical protein
MMSQQRTDNPAISGPASFHGSRGDRLRSRSCEHSSDLIADYTPFLLPITHYPTNALIEPHSQVIRDLGCVERAEASYDNCGTRDQLSIPRVNLIAASAECYRDR